MPVTAKFVADFREFEDAVHRATNVTLRDFQSGIGRVDKDLARFGNAFSGVKLIQDATLMAEAVDRVGGTTKLTGTELARVSAVAQEAAEKMRVLGVDIPPQIQRLADAAGSNTNAFRTFHTGLSQVDRTMAQLGINITPQVAALNEMALVAGRSAREVGILATAGAAAAAAFAGWQLGRWVADFFDLDRAIADTTAKLLGLGDVAAETAAARMDVLARASQVTGREITNMAEAVRILNEEAKRITPEELIQRAARAQQEVRNLTAAEREEIVVLLELGAKQGDVAKAYGISEGAIRRLLDLKKLHADQERILEAETKKAQAAMDAYTESVRRMTDAHASAVASIANRLFGLEDIERAQRYMEALGGIENVSRLSSTAQQELATVMTAGIEAMFRAGAGTDELTSKMEAFRLAATQSARDAAAAFQAIQAEAAAAAAAVAAAAQGLTIIGQSPASPFGPRESGVTVFGGQVAGSTADFSSALDRAFIRSNVGLGGGPSAFTGGYAVTINNHVDARESMYDTPASLERLADRVSESVMQRLLGFGYTVR